MDQRISELLLKSLTASRQLTASPTGGSKLGLLPTTGCLFTKGRQT